MEAVSSSKTGTSGKTTFASSDDIVPRSTSKVSISMIAGRISASKSLILLKSFLCTKIAEIYACFRIVSISNELKSGRSGTAIIPVFTIPKYEAPQFGQLRLKMAALSPFLKPRLNRILEAF